MDCRTPTARGERVADGGRRFPGCRLRVWRMFQTYVADDIDFEIEIFATPEEARSWLGESSS